MENLPVKFDITDAAISTLADKYKDLSITDTESYKLVTAGIGEIRSIRVSVEKRRKELKADALEYGRRLDTEAKRITELLLPIENDLKATKQAEDSKKEAIKIEKDRLEKERIETIQAKIAAFPPNMSSLPRLLWMPAPEIQEMQDTLTAIEIDIEDYQEFTPEAIKTKTDKAKLLQEYYIARIQADAEEKKRKAEAERIEQIRKDQEAKEEAFKKERVCLENERLAKIEAQRIIAEKTRKEQEQILKKQEDEQKAKQTIENARLDKIREEQEAEAQKLRDAQAKIDAQKKAIQDEQDRLENEKIERERIEQEKLAKIEADRIAKIEAEKQEKARIEQEAKEKVEKEKAEAEEKARQEALRPDKKALEIYLNDLSSNINMRKAPSLKTPEGEEVLLFIEKTIETMFIAVEKLIEKM